MEKISYMGKEVWPKRNKRGEYAHKSSYMPYITGAAVIGFGAFMLMNSEVKVEYQVAPIAHAAVISTSTPNLSHIVNIEEAKDKLVEYIGKCESGFVKEPDAAIIFDTNNRPSLGHLQFQIETVQAYVRLFEGRKIDRLEAEMIAHDHEKSHDLAKKIIFQDSKGWKNWLTCGSKVHADVVVQVIKSMEE